MGLNKGVKMIGRARAPIIKPVKAARVSRPAMGVSLVTLGM
jgi:hypothetical protein